MMERCLRKIYTRHPELMLKVICWEFWLVNNQLHGSTAQDLRTFRQLIHLLPALIEDVPFAENEEDEEDEDSEEKEGDYWCRP